MRLKKKEKRKKKKTGYYSFKFMHQLVHKVKDKLAFTHVFEG